jgi:hypothetical protein
VIRAKPRQGSFHVQASKKSTTGRNSALAGPTFALAPPFRLTTALGTPRTAAQELFYEECKISLMVGIIFEIPTN